MKCGVVTFPGSNCNHDMIYALGKILEQEVIELWHKEQDIKNCELIVLPGGFSYGDYLRSGAIARFSPIMKEVVKHAQKGGLVLGICNGFQILCEAGLLPGALIRNDCLEFRCVNQKVKVVDSNDRFNPAKLGNELVIPIAHGEGNYRLKSAELDKLESNNQVLLRYDDNPNGSINDIAGIRNEQGNVYGMMPHPERAVESYHPSTDGISILKSFLEPVLNPSSVELSAS